MKKTLNNIIQEEYYRLLKEYLKGDEVDWDLWEKRNEIKSSIFSDFLFNNNPQFDKHIPWRLVQYPMLKKVWEDYMRFGFLRSTKPLDTIESIMIANTLKIDVITELAGHSSVDPEEDFDEWFKPLISEYIQWKLQQKNPPDRQQLEIDYEKGGGAGKQPEDRTINPTPQEMNVFNFLDSQMSDYWERLEAGTIDLEDVENKADDILKGRFYDYYIEDPQSGQAYLSDYGLEPLANLVTKLRNLPEDQIGERIVTLDKMLNVVHQRSDLASWFVKGGSEALSDLSASPSEKAGQKQQNEGVGDKYAQTKFNIPDPGEEFQAKYQQHLKSKERDSSMGELVKEFDTEKLIQQNKEYTQIPVKARIFKNPKSLDKFEKDVRAISTESGDLYVADINGLFTHTEMGNMLFNERPYEIQKYVTWYRHGESNNFILASVSKTMYEKLMKGEYPTHFYERFWKGINKLKQDNPNFKFLGVGKNIKEGVGDVYAQQKFGIPDPEDEFEKEYQRYQKTQTQKDINGELMGQIQSPFEKNYGNVYKNPISLENFEPEVRAISDELGNVYVAQLDFPGYHDLIAKAVKEFSGSPYDSWQNMTWHRIGDSNMFGMSISFIEYYKAQLADPEKKRKMFNRIKLINKNNPTLVFMPFYWDYLQKEEVPRETLDRFLDAFGKLGVLKNY